MSPARDRAASDSLRWYFHPAASAKASPAKKKRERYRARVGTTPCAYVRGAARHRACPLWIAFNRFLPKDLREPCEPRSRLASARDYGCAAPGGGGNATRLNGAGRFCVVECADETCFS